MQQVIVIHGGETFSDHGAFLQYLRTKSIKVENLVYTPGWKESLQANLGSDYQVLLPSMPNKTNAKYEEWKIWFERITEVVRDDCVLVGHSLGGVFLAKYLSETVFLRRVKATILIAAPFNDESTEELTDFRIDELSELFKSQAGRVVLFNGRDDPVIPLTEAEKYSQYIPDALSYVLPAPDHFVRESFPELVDCIREI